MESDCPVLGEGPLAADRLEHANINPTTGLATDYLNHFNEVMMLLEMLPAMPECAEDVLAWKPMDYESHFETSGFSDKHLAIAAYRAAPEHLRDHLRRTVKSINGAVVDAQNGLSAAPDVGMVAGTIAVEAVDRIKPLISRASGIIHGHIGTETLQHEGDGAQAEIDAMFA